VEFGERDETLRRFIQATAQGQTRLESLIQGQADSIKHVIRTQTHISQQAITSIVLSESFKNREELLRVEQAAHAGPPLWQIRQRLLKSLKYSAMNDRLNQITEIYDGTYQWIMQGIRPWLEGDGGTLSPEQDKSHLHPDCSHAIGFPNVSWRCFPCWLESPSDKIYWIQGKAGSGKSTLMKFLLSECGGLSYPGAEPAGKDRIILYHFLWSAGAPLQRSIRGILLTLVQQFLAEEQELLDSVISSMPLVTLKDSHHEWKKNELETIIKQRFPKSKKSIFIFLDGLDEIGSADINSDDTPANLLRLLSQLASIERVKICVSSRLDPEFQRRLSKVPTLRLQDVTVQDMRVYAKDHLLQPELGPDSDKIYEELIESVCEKADGVFLWLALAVRSLARGLLNGDRLSELQQRLQEMPRGLYSLYQDMWSRINEDHTIYREEAARYFNMVRDWAEFAKGYSRIEVFHIVMASNPSKARAILEDFTAFSAHEITTECNIVARRITTRTAGLLEIGPDGSLVGFPHLSAVEFLENTPEGQQILAYDQTPLQTRTLNTMYAFLVGVCLQVVGQRETAAHLPKEQFWVMTIIYRIWASGGIPEDAGLELMMVCKKLYETGLWRKGPTEDDCAKDIYDALDFYGASASAGFAKTVSPLVEDGSLSDLSRRYLYAAACIDPNEKQDVDYFGKGAVVSDILGQGTVCDLEDPSTRLSLMCFATLNIHAGGRNWPRAPGVPTLPELLTQYLEASISLEDRFAFTLKRTPGEQEDIWRPNLNCIGSIENMYHRQSSTWVTFETDIVSMARLCLKALVAGSLAATAHEVQAAQKSLEDLRTAGLGNYMRILGFGFPMMGVKNGKPLAPGTSSDVELVVGCLEGIQLRPSESTGDVGGDMKEYHVPGLRACLIKITSSAKPLDEQELDRSKALPLQAAMLKLMTKPPKLSMT